MGRAEATTLAMSTKHDQISTNDWLGWRAEKWKARIQAMEAMLRPVDQELLAHLPTASALRIAEIGCGGGDTTQNIARNLHPESALHAFDISETLLDCARARNCHHPMVQYHQRDLSRDPPPPLPYHFLVSRFGVMFFDDPTRAFSNLFCWLKPGGGLLFAVWGRAQDNPVIAETRTIVGEQIALPTPQNTAPGPFRYGEVTLLEDQLRQSGFAGVRHRSCDFDLAVGGGLGAIDAATFALEAYSNFKERLESEGPDHFDRARDRLAEHFRRFEVDAQVKMRARVHFVQALRPG